ncbi:MAG: hypothetical protein IH987_02670 [Planctomycetes bacterium]|nr:hypothetical protein [Planctomycetota bacterium]
MKPNIIQSPTDRERKRTRHILLSRPMPKVVAILVLTITYSAGAGDPPAFDIPWFTIDGGGGMSQGGPFTVTGTIGQPDAGLMTGGGFAIAGGFWASFTVLQVPGDCNRDGIPDESQDMVNWIGESGSWHDPQNWDSGAVPATGQHVCINVPGDQTVTYEDGTTDIASLSCHESLVLNDTDFPFIKLILQGQSLVVGDLSIGGSSGNELQNNATLTVSGLFSVLPGRCGLSGPGDIIANGGLSVVSRATLLNGKALYLDNNSTGTSTTGGLIVLNSGCSVHVQAGSTFDLQGDSTAFSGSNGSFVNEGTFVRSSGNGTARIDCPVVNSGQIHVQSGELYMSGGGVHSGELRSDPGTLLKLTGTTLLPGSSLIADDIELGWGSARGNVDISGTMIVTGGTWTFTNTANIVSYGPDLIVSPGADDSAKVFFEAPTDAPIAFDTITIGNGQSLGTVQFNTGQPVNVNTLTMLRAAIQGSSPINVGDSFVWLNGNILAGGDLALNGDSLVQSTSSARTVSRNLINAGNFTMFGGFTLGSGAQFTNLATGVYDIQGDTARISFGSFQNNGLLVRSAGGAAAEFNGTDLFNVGTVEIQSGELEFSSANYIQTAGQIILNGGNLRMSFGTTAVQINGGSLTGVGTVFGDVRNNGGVVEPGLSVGELAIDGDFTQPSAGVLHIEIGGLTPAVDHDQLIVTGSAVIDGALVIEFVNEFVPNPGDSFVVLTAGTLSGSFSLVSPPGNWTVAYDNNEVAVTLATPPCGFVAAADFDFDCDIDLTDVKTLIQCLTGPSAPIMEGCAVTDLHADGHTDLRDFSEMQNCFSGADNLVICGE